MGNGKISAKNIPFVNFTLYDELLALLGVFDLSVKNMLAALLLCGLIAGCAAPNEMALDQEDIGVDVRTQSMLLMTLSLSEPGRTLLEPAIDTINVETTDANGKTSRQVVDPDQEGMVEKDGRVTYMLRIALTPGSYSMVSAPGMIGLITLLGHFRVPLLENFDVPPHSVVYLGHMEVVLRPKTPGEFAAGPFWPPVPQSATGISGGTFDVTVTDASAQDIPLFATDFPALKGIPIKIEILPPWNRRAATIWSATH
jgi:hypothetical protein